MNEPGELSERERDLLRTAKRDVPPPPAVEANVVSALRASGRIKPPHNRWAMLRVAVLVIAAFGGGVAYARLSAAPIEPERAPRFMLLLYGGDNGEHRAEYSAWATTIASQGIRVSGEELASEAISVPWRDDQQALTSLRGYFTLAGVTEDQAEQFARSCPHAKYGGTIVVRPIVD